MQAAPRALTAIWNDVPSSAAAVFSVFLNASLAGARAATATGDRNPFRRRGGWRSRRRRSPGRRHSQSLSGRRSTCRRLPALGQLPLLLCSGRRSRRHSQLRGGAAGKRTHRAALASGDPRCGAVPERWDAAQ